MKPTWTKVAIAWGLLLISGAIVMFELASGFSFTLPIIGTVPGPPSETMVHSLDTSVLLICGIIALLAVPVIARGTWLKRTAVAIPMFVSVWFLVVNIAERILK